MRFHILGICGTFMSGIAILAKQSGHQVTGCDTNIYPPMSTQLKEQGIEVKAGYQVEDIPKNIDQIIVGNVIKRGNPVIEYVLNNKIPFISGPHWLAEHVLRDRWVLAVAGTHGKTTTTSLLAWILETAGLSPGFLIGGIPENFGVSARIGEAPYFIIEADEYDSAFFDKRSKFMHYRPKTLILNNLEYDHADIFSDLNAIKQQFHFLIKTIPANGLILHQAEDENLADVLSMGCWTPQQNFGKKEGATWRMQLLQNECCHFKVFYHNKLAGHAEWSLLGEHNIMNGLAALAAAKHVDVPIQTAIKALKSFKNVKRRLEIKGSPKNIFVYDDFAHHPTAIAATLSGLRAKVGKHVRIIAVLEFGSYTMRSGVHKEKMKEALLIADRIVFKATSIDWGLEQLLKQFNQPAVLYHDVETLVDQLVPQLKSGDHVVIMSNLGFDGIHSKLINKIEEGWHTYA